MSSHRMLTRLRDGLIALGVLTLAAGAVAHGAPVMTVNGAEITSPIVYPEKRRHEWFLPAAAIAQALETNVIFDGATLSVGVTSPFDGSVIEYDGTTGEVRRDGVLTLALEPGLPSGATSADLLLPLTLTAIVFDVEVYVSPDETEIALRSRLGSTAPGLSSLRPIAFEELRYQGYAYQYVDQTSWGLGLESRSRVGSGALYGNAYGQGAGTVAFGVRSYLLAYRHRSGHAWRAGFLRTPPPVRWLGAAGRGLRWDAEVDRGARRFAVGYTELTAGYVGLASGVTKPVFDGEMISASYAYGARPGSAQGTSVGFGAAWLTETEEEDDGLLLAVQHRYGSSDFRVQNMGGVFWTPGALPRDRVGFEVAFDWTPMRTMRLNSRLGQFGSEFRLPVRAFPERGTRFLSAGTAFLPMRSLSLNAAHSIHQPLAPESGRPLDQLSSLAATLHPRTRMVRAASITYSHSILAHVSDTRHLALDIRGDTPTGSWFLIGRRRVGTGFPSTFTAGTTVGTGVGWANATVSWHSGDVDAIGAQWTRPFLVGQQLMLTLGGRWSRPLIAEQDEFQGYLRATWRFGGDHRLDLAVDEQPVGTATRVNVRGRLELAERRSLLGNASLDRPMRDVARIEGRAYLDRNASGTFDDGDRPLRDIRLTLDGGRYTTVTGSDGRYEFDGVRPGRHTLITTAETIRADLSLMVPVTRSVTVASFRTLTLDVPTTINRTIRGIVYRDENGNRRRDAGEPGVPEVHVVLTGASDTLTEPDGSFRIGDVPPGIHLVAIDRTSLGENDVAFDAQRVEVSADGDPEPIAIPIAERGRPVRRRTF